MFYNHSQEYNIFIWQPSENNHRPTKKIKLKSNHNGLLKKNCNKIECIARLCIVDTEALGAGGIKAAIPLSCGNGRVIIGTDKTQYLIYTRHNYEPTKQ